MGSASPAFLLGILMASMAAASPAPDSPPSVTSLKDMPNTTVRYYDVAGSDVTAINRSIARQRPRAPGAKLSPAATDWRVKVVFDRQVSEGQCRIRGAKAEFAATADLPRLNEPEALDPATRARWAKYVAALEQSELATLAFVYSQLGGIEELVGSSSCEEARSVATAAVARLQKQAAAFEAGRTLRLANSTFEATDGRPEEQPRVCRTLVPTGTRVETLRVCMSRRDWQRLHESGQQATREMQDKPRVNRPF